MASDIEEISLPSPTPLSDASALAPNNKKRRLILRVTSDSEPVNAPDDTTVPPRVSHSSPTPAPSVPPVLPPSENAATQLPTSHPTAAPAHPHLEPAQAASTSSTPVLSKPQIPDFRLKLKQRAKENNAADSNYFKGNKALVFNFLGIEDAKEDDVGKLVSCVLRCCLCTRGKWTFAKSGKGAGSTGNMNAHMNGKHGAIWAEAKREEKRAAGITLDDNEQPSVADMLSSSFNLDTLHEKIVKWITIANQPFTEIESEELLGIFGYLRPAVEGRIIKADALKNRIVAASEVQRQRFKDYLQSIPSLMPIALDAWTSSNRIAFLAIVGTFITKEWRTEEVLLDFVEMHGAHDGRNMANCLAKTVAELELLPKMIALAADNASNNGTLITEFTKLVPNLVGSSETEVRWDGSKAQIRCLPHVVHLGVMALLFGIKAIPAETSDSDFSSEPMSVEDAETLALENNLEVFLNERDADVDPLVDLGSAVAKLRKICRIVRSSPQRMETFKKTVMDIENHLVTEAKGHGKEYTPKKPLNLLLDVCTRWNSVLFMLERALLFRQAIDALCVHPIAKLCSPYRLSEAEWALVETVSSWLKFFRRASTLMSGDQYVTLSSSLAVYATLMGYVSKLLDGPEARSSPPLKNGLTACHEKLEKFFDKATFDTEYYYFATVLDPRYKDTIFKRDSDLFSEAWVKGCHDSFIEILDRHYPAEDGEILGVDSPGVLPTRPTEEFDAALLALLPAPKEPRIPHRLELERFLKAPLTAADPLDWWRVTGQSKYPRLSRMARDFLAIPGSSVSVERCLNIGRDVISLRRASLSAETIRLLMTYRAELLLEKRLAKATAQSVLKRNR